MMGLCLIAATMLYVIWPSSQPYYYVSKDPIAGTKSSDGRESVENIQDITLADKTVSQKPDTEIEDRNSNLAQIEFRDFDSEQTEKNFDESGHKDFDSNDVNSEDAEFSEAGTFSEESEESQALRLSESQENDSDEDPNHGSGTEDGGADIISFENEANPSPTTQPSASPMSNSFQLPVTFQMENRSISNDTDSVSAGESRSANSATETVFNSDPDVINDTNDTASSFEGWDNNVIVENNTTDQRLDSAPNHILSSDKIPIIQGDNSTESESLEINSTAFSQGDISENYTIDDEEFEFLGNGTEYRPNETSPLITTNSEDLFSGPERLNEDLDVEDITNTTDFKLQIDAQESNETLWRLEEETMRTDRDLLDSINHTFVESDEFELDYTTNSTKNQ